MRRHIRTMIRTCKSARSSSLQLEALPRVATGAWTAGLQHLLVGSRSAAMLWLQQLQLQRQRQRQLRRQRQQRWHQQEHQRRRHGSLIWQQQRQQSTRTPGRGLASRCRTTHLLPPPALPRPALLDSEELASSLSRLRRKLQTSNARSYIQCCAGWRRLLCGPCAPACGAGHLPPSPPRTAAWRVPVATRLAIPV